MPLSSPVHHFAAQAAIWCHWIPGNLHPYGTRMSRWNGSRCIGSSCVHHQSLLFCLHIPRWLTGRFTKHGNGECSVDAWEVHVFTVSQCSLVTTSPEDRPNSHKTRSQSKADVVVAKNKVHMFTISLFSFSPSKSVTKMPQNTQLRWYHDGCMLSWCVHVKLMCSQAITESSATKMPKRWKQLRCCRDGCM